MNIEEIRQARVEAERVILEVLTRFKETTGLAVVGVDVETYATRDISGRIELHSGGAVRLKIEPI